MKISEKRKPRNKYKKINLRNKYKKSKLRKVQWASEYDWDPILEYDYSCIFDTNCNIYAYCFETVTEALDLQTESSPTESLTLLERNLFVPIDLYIGSDSKPVIFDSGCTLTVTPFATYF